MNEGWVCVGLGKVKVRNQLEKKSVIKLYTMDKMFHFNGLYMCAGEVHWKKIDCESDFC